LIARNTFVRNRWFGYTCDMTPRTDAALMTLAARGDDAAFAEIHHRHAAWARGCAVRLAGDRHAVADDAVQDAFLDLWRAAERYDASHESLRPWLATIVRHRVLDVLRRRSHWHVDLETIAELPSPDETADVIVHRAISARRLAAAIDDLPEPQRQAVTLSYFDGLSHSEIAEHIGVALGTVKGRLRLAIGKLSTPELRLSLG
jgi:RNA polymerase sigma-70 factor (ECF subfamily)